MLMHTGTLYTHTDVNIYIQVVDMYSTHSRRMEWHKRGERARPCRSFRRSLICVWAAAPHFNAISTFFPNSTTNRDGDEHREKFSSHFLFLCSTHSPACMHGKMKSLRERNINCLYRIYAHVYTSYIGREERQ